MADLTLSTAQISTPGAINAANGNFSVDQTGNTTAVGNLKGTHVYTTGGTIGVTTISDLVDGSNSNTQNTVYYKTGPNCAKMCLFVAGTTGNITDSNANQINSGSKITGSTNTAVNHNYAGTLTPTIILTMLTVAGNVIWGSIGATQATITMSAAGAYVAEALLI